jgi:hypothetical protein
VCTHRQQCLCRSALAVGRRLAYIHPHGR